MEGPKIVSMIKLMVAFGLLTLLAVGCGAAATPAPQAQTVAPAATQAPVATEAPVVGEATVPPAPIARAAATLAPLPVAQPTEPPLAPGAPARKPRGTLTISEFDFDVESWLPWEVVTQRFYWERVMETLVRLDPVTWEFLPGLAESWDVAEDGRKVTFHLQKGVQFHDGWGEFTSADAEFSLNEWLFNEESVHPSVNALKEAGATVRAVDRYTVEVEFTKSPFLTALMDLSSGNNGTGMLSKAYVDKVGLDKARRTPIGTGPYVFVEHKLGESITLEALDEHWRIVPQWKTLKILVTPEPSTRLAQILSKEVDIALLPGSFKRQAEAAGVRTLLNPGVAGVFLVPVVYIPGTTGIEAPNPDNPMADKRFVEALSLAINRQELADVVFAGGAVPTGITDLSPASLGYDEKWETPDPFDPERARQLLRESGKEGLTFEFQQRPLGGIPELPQVAEAIAGMWEAVGLNVNLKLNIPAQQHSEMRRARVLEGKIWLMRLGHLIDTTRRLMSQLHCTGERTPLFACNEELEVLSTRIAASTNLEEKDRLMRDAYTIILEQRTVIPVVQTATLYAIGDRVGQWTPRLGERFTTEIELIGHAD